jgi:hypothetical protein
VTQPSISRNEEEHGYCGEQIRPPKRFWGLVHHLAWGRGTGARLGRAALVDYIATDRVPIAEFFIRIYKDRSTTLQLSEELEGVKEQAEKPSKKSLD